MVIFCLIDSFFQRTISNYGVCMSASVYIFFSLFQINNRTHTLAVVSVCFLFFFPHRVYQGLLVMHSCEPVNPCSLLRRKKQSRLFLACSSTTLYLGTVMRIQSSKDIYAAVIDMH